MRYQIGRYIVEQAAIKGANWARIDSGNPTSWERERWDNHKIVAVHGDDETWWDGIEAYGIPATDVADGKAYTINIIIDVCDNDDSHVYAGETYTDEIPRVYEIDDDGEPDRYVAPYDLALVAGYELVPPTMRYDEAAAAFLADHDGYRYIMDNARGFANEWTLYACANDEEAKEALESFENVTEYNPEDAEKWIRSALQTPEDYNAEHGCDKWVALKYWADNEIY